MAVICSVSAQTRDKSDEPGDLVSDTADISPYKYDDGGDTLSDYEYATPEPAKPLRLQNDTSALTAREADNDKLNEFRHDPDFDYSDTLDESESRSFSWRPPPRSGGGSGGGSRTISVPVSTPAFSFAGGQFWLYLIGAIAVGIIAYLIATSFKGKSRRAKATDTQASTEAKTEENTEDIRELDFDSLLAQVVASGDYRRAVRLLYLQSLRALVDRKMIEWHIHTSNREYHYQIPQGLRPSFERITDAFEYVWYGELPVTQSLFERMRGAFTDFNTRIAQHA